MCVKTDTTFHFCHQMLEHASRTNATQARDTAVMDALWASAGPPDAGPSRSASISGADQGGLARLVQEVCVLVLRMCGMCKRRGRGLRILQM